MSMPTNPRLQFEADRYAVVLSLGSNLGNSDELLAWAVARAKTRSEATQVSGLYSTPPWGLVDQPDFRNVTMMASGPMTPLQWLLWGNDLEAKALRVRHERWGPRTLDVDIIAASFLTRDGELQPVRSNDPALTLPHPRAMQRAFVLIPWLEIEPYAWFQDRTLAELVEDLDPAEREGIVRVGDVPKVDPTIDPPVGDVRLPGAGAGAGAGADAPHAPHAQTDAGAPHAPQGRA